MSKQKWINYNTIIFPFKKGVIWENGNSASLNRVSYLSSFVPVAVVFLTILVLYHAVSVHLIIWPISIYRLSILAKKHQYLHAKTNLQSQHSLPMLQIIKELPFIYSSIWPKELSLALHLVLFPLALVAFFIAPDIDPYNEIIKNHGILYHNHLFHCFERSPCSLSHPTRWIFLFRAFGCFGTGLRTLSHQARLLVPIRAVYLYAIPLCILSLWGCCKLRDRRLSRLSTRQCKHPPPHE